MLIMALDTALQSCSVAVLRDGAVLAEKSVGMERGHAEHLAPMTAASLKEAGVKVTDLDRIGVVVGPGGFTGVRVALAFARGLAIGTSIPVAGVTSLAALAENISAPDGTLKAAVIDARRSQVYAGLYGRSGEVLAAPFVASPEQALNRLSDKAGDASVLTVGSGAGLLPSLLANWRASDAPDQIDAKAVARLAAAAPTPKASPAPVYLRPPDAKPPKPGPFEGLLKS